MGGFYQARAFVLRMGDSLTGRFLEKNFATFLWHGIITETAVVLCLGGGKAAWPMKGWIRFDHGSMTAVFSFRKGGCIRRL